VTGAEHAEHIDLQALLKGFHATFSGSFDILEARISGSPGDPWLLTAVQPRQAGHFVIRYDVWHEPYFLAPKGETWICEYHLMIGARRKRRYCTTRYAWPLACVGDIVVIPIRVNRVFSKHQFFAQGADERFDRTMAESDREAAESDPLQPFSQPITIQNRMPHRLKLLGSGGRTTGHRPMDRYGHDLVGLFQAQKAGQFNIRLAPEKTENETRTHARAVRVAPEGAMLRVLAVRCNETRTDGARRFGGGPNWEWDTLVLRIGDRFVAGYGYTDARQRPPFHPALQLTAEPFQPGGWAPFDIELPAGSRR